MQSPRGPTPVRQLLVLNIYAGSADRVARPLRNPSVHAACLGLLFPKVRWEPNNHELGVSPTTGSAALRGGFRVRVRGLFYFFMVSKNVRNHELGVSLTTS